LHNVVLLLVTEHTAYGFVRSGKWKSRQLVSHQVKIRRCEMHLPVTGNTISLALARGKLTAMRVVMTLPAILRQSEEPQMSIDKRRVIRVEMAFLAA
jgi:hypothetical protein